MRILLAIVAVAACLPSMRAAEGLPRWSRLVDEIVKRAETEAFTPKTTDDRDQDAAPPASDLHPTVMEFIRYYRGAGAKTWSSSLRRLETVRPMVEQTFAEYGVPETLMWLGLVESGYKPYARSPKSAVGMWQFIPETARRFGLRVGKEDERTDVAKATVAAAKYLQFLYTLFGDWKLVLAAYNSGEARVQSAIERSGSRDFWTLADQGYLPREARAYVPAVLAAQFLAQGTDLLETAKHAHSNGRGAHIVEAPFSLSP
jgi:membrane-bound lytic murein transglycosylase D